MEGQVTQWKKRYRVPEQRHWPSWRTWGGFLGGRSLGLERRAGSSEVKKEMLVI